MLIIILFTVIFFIIGLRFSKKFKETHDKIITTFLMSSSGFILGLVISTFITISVRNKFDNIPDQIIKLKNLNYTISNDAYYLKIIGYSDNKDTCYIYTDFYNEKSKIYNSKDSSYIIIKRKVLNQPKYKLIYSSFILQHDTIIYDKQYFIKQNNKEKEPIKVNINLN
jgi:uncharacterized protein YacL